MIAGIITVPERQKELETLKKLIEPKVFKLATFIDEEHRGHWFNLSRCMKLMFDMAEKDEPVLIMTDDVTTVPDWYERWEAIHKKARNNIYVMMARQKHLFSKENIKRGYFTGLQLRGFYDHAVIYINQKDLMSRVMNWFDNGGCELPRVKNRTKHLDVVIQEYLLYNKIPWTITIPTLFDHIGKSTIGHNVGSSPLFIGNYEKN